MAGMTTPPRVLAMIMTVHLIGLVAVAAALALAGAAGLWWRRRDGRFTAPGGDAALVTGDEVGAPLGARATLLQFSSEFCAPCRTTRTLLADLAGTAGDVAHTELDAAEHLDLVRRLDVMRTPTVFVLDRDGRVVRRASGAPRRDEITAALAALT